MSVKVLFFVIVSAVLFTGCSERNPRGEMFKFLETIPTISQTNMQVAFTQMNAVLKYYTVPSPKSKGSLEATYETKEKTSFTLLASPQLPKSAQNEFGLSLIIIPFKADTVLKTEIFEFLKKYKKITVNRKEVWQIKGWLFEMKEPNILEYYSASTRTIYD